MCRIQIQLFQSESYSFQKQLLSLGIFNSQIRYCLQYLPVIISYQHMKQPSKQQHPGTHKPNHRRANKHQQQIDIHQTKNKEPKSHRCFPQISAQFSSSAGESQSEEEKQDEDYLAGQQKKAKNSKKVAKMKAKFSQKQEVKLIEDNQKCKQATGQSSQANLIGDLSFLSKEEVPLNTPTKINIKKSITPKSRKNRTAQKYDKDQDDSIADVYQFPFTNQYIEKNSQQFLSTVEAIEKAKVQLRHSNSPGTFLNCDVRYFNWELFIQEVGKFDVLIIDPPWRIKGAQQNDSQFMFSNCKFSLEYNTMGNSQIARIPLNLISDQGFIFLWILNSQLDTSIQIMQTWGYELVDQITWVKLRDGKIYLTHGYYFMHSYEICLIGYKNNKKSKDQKMNSPQDRLKIRGSLMNNTMFAQVKKKSQKPQDLYSIIQMMFSGKRKVQVFARNHNLRFGVFSIGNQLGQSYQKWNLNLNCDKCGKPIEFGTMRYKSKLVPNYDLCHRCIEQQNKIQFFEISNQVDEGIRHQYVSCNHCGVQPIWGIRFQCVTCQDFDICQNCYDKNLSAEVKFHPIDHEYRFLEIPVFGNGFPIHDVKCFSCYQNPIIGIYFNCTYCKNYKQCQKCYFQRPKTDTNSRNHKSDHQMEVLFNPQVNQEKKYECFACQKQILQNCYMCENCYNFFFCEKCFQKKESFKSLYANSHKKYHVYTKIF